MGNVNLIDSSVGTVANMVRFRSPSMDVGTSWEMGYTAGQGKPVFGYYDAVPFYGETEEPGTYPEKVVQYGYADESNTGYDHDNLEIEGFGFSDNLMLLGNLEMTGYANMKPSMNRALMLSIGSQRTAWDPIAPASPLMAKR